MLKAIQAQDDRATAQQNAERRREGCETVDAAALLVARIEETLYHYTFPRETLAVSADE